MAHRCLNALAALQVGLAALGDLHPELAPHERDVLMKDVMSGIRKLEALSESLARGVHPGDCVSDMVRVA
jgi:hypothetical protein